MNEPEMVRGPWASVHYVCVAAWQLIEAAAACSYGIACGMARSRLLCSLTPMHYSSVHALQTTSIWMDGSHAAF